MFNYWNIKPHASENKTRANGFSPHKCVCVFTMYV